MTLTSPRTASDFDFFPPAEAPRPSGKPRPGPSTWWWSWWWLSFHLIIMMIASCPFRKPCLQDNHYDDDGDEDIAHDGDFFWCWYSLISVLHRSGVFVVVSLLKHLASSFAVSTLKYCSQNVLPNFVYDNQNDCCHHGWSPYNRSSCSPLKIAHLAKIGRHVVSLVSSSSYDHHRIIIISSNSSPYHHCDHPHIIIMVTL